MDLFCPRCKKVIAIKLPSGMFKIYSSDKSNGKNIVTAKKALGQLLCMLPVSVTCGKRRQRHSINSAGTYGCLCHSVKTQRYTAKHHEDEWVSLDLSTTHGSIDCADARMMCVNPECEEELFLKEFAESGKSLGTEQERRMKWMAARTDGKLYIRATDDPPQEWIDYEV